MITRSVHECVTLSVLAWVVLQSAQTRGDDQGEGTAPPGQAVQAIQAADAPTFVSEPSPPSPEVIFDGPVTPESRALRVTSTRDPSSLSGLFSLDTPSLSSGFEGISQSQAGGYYPSDCHLAVGPNNVVQVVNQRIRVTSKSGATQYDSALASFFSVVIPTGWREPFDPWVAYDHFANRFVLIAISRSTDQTSGAYLLAVSQSADPSGGWWLWAIRNDDYSGEDRSEWGDYEKIGFNSHSFYVTSNQFSSFGSFLYSRILAFNKTALYNGQGFSFTSWTRTGYFTMQPCQVMTGESTQYFIEKDNGSGSTANIWSMTGTQAGSYVLSSPTSVSIGSYQSPTVNGTNPVRQFGTSSGVNAGDGRFLGAALRNGHIYSCFTEGVTGQAYNTQIRVVILNAGNATRVFDGSFNGGDRDYFYPAIMPFGSSVENFYLCWSSAGPNYYVGGRYTRHLPGDWEASVLLKAGEATYERFDGSGRNRWGDYNGIWLDGSASTSDVWVYTQYADSSSANSWGSWVGGTPTPSPPPPPPPPPPSGCLVEKLLDEPILRRLVPLAESPKSQLDTKVGVLVGLRRLRDVGLKSSVDGQELVELYYQHSGELYQAAISNPALLRDTLAILMDLVTPLKEQDPGTGRLTLDTVIYERGLKLVSRYEQSGSARLRTAVSRLREFLETRSTRQGDFVEISLKSSANDRSVVIPSRTSPTQKSVVSPISASWGSYRNDKGFTYAVIISGMIGLAVAGLVIRVRQCFAVRGQVQGSKGADSRGWGAGASIPL